VLRQEKATKARGNFGQRRRPRNVDIMVVVGGVNLHM
jgi:hypothetical protein